MSPVFISHSSRDRDASGGICHGLEARGITCWHSGRDLEPGENYQDVIHQVIGAASALVLVYSHNSQGSDEVKKELSLASKMKLPVIPVRIDDAMPESGFAFELSTRQYLDLAPGDEAGLDRLAARIEAAAREGGGDGAPALPAPAARRRAMRLAGRVLTRWGLLATVLLAVLAFTEASLLDRLTAPMLGMIAEGVTAAAAPAAVPGGPKRWGEQTAVVMITDNDSPDMAELWPLPPAAYQLFLKRAWCMGARSVFIDISLPAPAGDLAAMAPLRDLVSLLSGVGPSPQRAALWTETCQGPGMDPAAGADRRMAVFFAPPFNSRVAALFAPFNRAALVADGNFYLAADTERSRLTTAAYALAEDACRTDPVAFAGCAGPRHSGGFVVPDTIFTPAAQHAWFTQPDRPAGDAACLYRDSGRIQLGAFLAELGRMAIGGPRTDWLTCPPLLTVPWHRLFEPAGSANTAAALRGRAVLLSSAVSGTADHWQTLFHRQLPGVYLHALATETLLAGRVPVAPWWQERLLLVVLAALIALGLQDLRGRLVARQIGTGRADAVARLACAVPAWAIIACGPLALALAYAALGWPLAGYLRDAACVLAVAVLALTTGLALPVWRPLPASPPPRAQGVPYRGATRRVEP